MPHSGEADSAKDRTQLITISGFVNSITSEIKDVTSGIKEALDTLEPDSKTFDITP